MKVISGSAPFLLRLLLLAELLVCSWGRPAHVSSLCGTFGSMIPQVDRLMDASKQLHGLIKEELENFAAAEHRLKDLPHIQHTASYFSSLKVNESLSQLYSYSQSFKLHVDWLKTAKENVSLSVDSAESSRVVLQQLNFQVNSSLQQIGADVPPSASPSLPDVSSAFDALKFSVELSERLQTFCSWSKRVLRHLQRLSRCPRH